MSVSAVVDASALLALLFDEPGAETVSDVISAGACVGTVNLGEVATVLVRNDRDPGEILGHLRDQVAVQPFTEADALAVAVLYPRVSGKGLSLGDRACLALAQRLDLPAVSAEHSWNDLPIDIAVRLIRPPRS